MTWCVFVLFLDLVKAFDRIIREMVLGWPTGFVGDGFKYLLELGVNEEAAKWIAEFVNRTSGLLSFWGADPKARALTTAIHIGSWFRYGDLQTVITTELGGRQGCKLGSLIFNGGYSISRSYMVSLNTKA